MNKRLFVLICSIILFQYIYNSECTEEDADSSKECTSLGVSADNKKCVANDVADATEKCKEDTYACKEKTFENPTDDFCRTLKLDESAPDKICIKVGQGCDLETKCDKATGDDDNACKKYPTVTKGNICKKDTTKDSKNCIEVKEESKNGANHLKISLAFLISLILF